MIIKQLAKLIMYFKIKRACISGNHYYNHTQYCEDGMSIRFTRICPHCDNIQEEYVTKYWFKTREIDFKSYDYFKRNNI